MHIGYLQLSPAQSHESGVARYGRYLAQAVQRQQRTVEVQEFTLKLSDKEDFQPSLKEALKRFQHCDVLHIQYSKYIGLTGWKKLHLLKLIQQNFRGKIFITIHDVYADIYPTHSFLKALSIENSRQRKFSQHRTFALRSTARQIWHNYLADRATIEWILLHYEQPIVCNQTEAERLKHVDRYSRITVIPHFVEPRDQPCSKAKAKASLGLENRKIITLQGFIYRTKGHDMLLNALSLLPDNYDVIFAGGLAPNNETFQDELNTQIRRLGLEERVRITGYLSEKDLELYMSATDLAVCPFQVTSASGSLSTWVSMERPILAFALPQVEELNKLVPGAISVFEDYNPNALAEAIHLFFSNLSTEGNSFPSPIQQLKEKLSLAQIAHAHVAIYRDAMSRAANADCVSR